MLQWSSVWYAGFLMYAEQPLPAPDQADSDQPRALSAATRLVPPTARTPGVTAGNCAAVNPASPDDATMTWPLCL